MWDEFEQHNAKELSQILVLLILGGEEIFRNRILARIDPSRDANHALFQSRSNHSSTLHLLFLGFFCSTVVSCHYSLWTTYCVLRHVWCEPAVVIFFYGRLTFFVAMASTLT